MFGNFVNPSYVSITGLLKAIPVEDGGDRFVYIEASNETRDYEGERVLCKALAGSADYYREYGNVDLDHLTLLGPTQGIPDYHFYEIGQPVEVRFSPPDTFVKAHLYRGESQAARHAEEVWASLTRQHPPARWYPSVGGAVLSKSSETDPETGEPEVHVTGVRWTNIGLSRTPVNLNVPTVATVPIGVFAKAWSARGLNLRKALDASSGASTDVSALTGGAALGRQSLDRKVHSYWHFRDAASKALLKGKTKGTADSLHALAVAQGVPSDEAAEWVERFLADINRNRHKYRRAA